jgi:hypothetical protein
MRDNAACHEQLSGNYRERARLAFSQLHHKVIDMKQHTPGPWIVHTSGSYIEVGQPWPSDGREKPPHPIGVCVARMTGHSPVAHADARLMAAAPELLEILLAYVELEESAAPYSSSPMRERARAIIAKAKGPAS